MNLPKTELPFKITGPSDDPVTPEVISREITYAIPEYIPKYAGEAVTTARSYWEARRNNQIVFSYGVDWEGTGRTRGGHGVFEGEVSDMEYRGIIDCSTYMGLVLRGISFEKSPYAHITHKKQTCDPSKLVCNPLCVWADKGIEDWNEEFYLNGNIRYAADLAKYMWINQRCFTDVKKAKPGDLIFFAGVNEKGTYFINKRFKHISHVAMIAEETWPDNNPISYYHVTRCEKVLLRSQYTARNDISFFARPQYSFKNKYNQI